MFGIKHNECVGFESKWKVTRVITDNTSQTTEFSTSETSCNTSEIITKETQTDPVEVPTNELPVDVDMDKLASFLRKVYPEVKKEVDDFAGATQAFKNYKLMGDDEELKCKLLSTVKVTSGPEDGGDQTSKVAAMSWNNTGKTLAISCNFEHDTWCHHTGIVEIFMLDKEDLLPNISRQKLSTDSCVTCLNFHPNHPAIIAAGLFSGGLIIWNIHRDDDFNLIVKIEAHEEPVTNLCWLNDIDILNNILLATSSTDGLLKLWNFDLSSDSLTIKANYKIKMPVFNRIARKKDLPERIAKKICRGILCFDFSTFIPDMFVVGIEGGLIVQCSVLGATQLKGSTAEEPLLDPVYKYYQPMEGEINSLSFSPMRKEMFLAGGTDGEIQIYLIGQDEPAQVIFTKAHLNSIVWVPREDKLIAGCGTSGILEIYHVIKKKAFEDITDEKVAKNTLTQMAINRVKPSLTAVGASNGTLQLWNVPWNLFGNFYG